MKKLMIFAVATLMLAACSNKTKGTATNADSTQVEVPDTLNSAEAVTKQVNDDFIEQTLPNTAVQKDENAEVVLYTNLDIAPPRTLIHRLPCG